MKGTVEVDSVLPYRSMAYNNQWANHRLLSACAVLTEAEFATPRVGFFPSLKATLNHTLVVDWFYVDAMEGGQLGPAAWADLEPCKTVLDLHHAQGQVDRRLINLVEGLDGNSLGRIVEVHRGTRIHRERMDRLLLHLLQHQIHHRGQAHGMMSSTPAAPPQLDEFFLEEDAALRAGEFSELGWTEANIWDPHG